MMLADSAYASHGEVFLFSGRSPCLLFDGSLLCQAFFNLVVSAKTPATMRQIERELECNVARPNLIISICKYST